MLVIDSSRARALLAAGWLAFAIPNAALMFLLPGEETIPYHLIWASFAFLYGVARWSRATTWLTFAGITIVTGIPLIKHAINAVIGWEECSEIVLMGVIAALLVWHVNRSQAAQQRIAELRKSESVRAYNRELATRFGSHELRTRLTVARGFTDLIRETVTDERTSADAEVVLRELDKASVLATNLMTLVRVDVRTVPTRIDVDAVIDGVVPRWAARVDRKWTGTSTVGTILGDAERLEAALDCLIENAVKFTELGDSISVVARIEGNDVVVRVSDSGAGIPAEDLPHVTELFHISANAGERGGSGLGLPIVRAIVEARGGALTVTSSLGSGTCVTMRTPYTGPGMLRHDPVEFATPQVVRTPQVPAVVQD
jgi:two-component system, OmpR family, sensor kinase